MIIGIPVGCNSVHRTGESFRSRGLYIYPLARGKGFAEELLNESIQIAKENNASFIWTFPRKSSMKAYEKCGFEKTSDFIETDNGLNCYASARLS